MQLAISLPTDTKLPVYKQVSDALRDAILNGRLKPGDKLPSTRELADSLNVSRFTVIRSYEELVSQGYIQTSSGSGTFVNPGLALELLVEQRYRSQSAAQVAPQEVRLSDYGNRVATAPEIESGTAELFAELNYGAPTFDQLPINAWRKALYKSSRFGDDEVLIYENDPFGYMPLREAIASYLARSRSVSCSPEQVAIFSGSEAGFDLLGRILLNRGDVVAMEDPGFAGARRSFMAQGCALLPVPVDEEGMIVDELQYYNEGVRLVHVTPSHQAPTGVVMTAARRLQLLKWAIASGSFILEDDFDNEFRFAGKPVQALQGLDQNDCVIYSCSFWKILYPVLRIGYMVIPKRLTSVVHRAKSIIERDFPLLEQRALTEFINEGHLERHIKRTRDLYANRRVALIHALTKHFGKRISVNDSVGGTDIMVRFNLPIDPHTLLKMAVEAKVSLVNTNYFYLSEPRPNEFLMGFAHLDVEHIQNTIGDFAARVDAAIPLPVVNQ